VESEDGEKAGVGVDDGVEDGIDTGVGLTGRGGEIWCNSSSTSRHRFFLINFFVTGLRAEICTGAGVCASWGVCFGVLEFSSWGVQVGAFCEFLVSILRWSKPPHYVKVNPLGELSF
jgi:hypothetical protein